MALTARAAIDLTTTGAATAFKSGDYEAAASEFAALAAENPGDVTVLRYLGITLQKLERYDDALVIFHEALTLEPDSVAVNYHTAVTLYKAGAIASAAAYFRSVIALDAQSRYSELAREYLDSISEQLARAQRPGDVKRFGFYAQLAGQYDSNLLALPDDSPYAGDRSATRGSGYLSGQYSFYSKDGWLGTADLSGYLSGYDESEFSAFDVRQFNPGIAIQKSGRWGNAPVINSARVDWLEVDIDGKQYSETSAFTLASRFALSDNTGTRIRYRYASDDFVNEGFDPRFSSRDADNHEAGIRNTWYLHDRRIELDLGLSYHRNDADGVNFVYDGFAVAAAARIMLPRDWWLDLAADWSTDDYDEFAGPVRRETDAYDATLAIRRWFSDRFLVQFDAAWHQEDSSYAVLSWDRYTIGINLSYVY